MIRRLLAFGTTLAVGVTLAGCGGGTASVVPKPAGAPQSGQVSNRAPLSADGSDILYYPHSVGQLGFADQNAPGDSPDINPSYCKTRAGSVIKACYTPYTLRNAYNVPSNLDGTGQTVVIVDAFGGPTTLRDLNTFSRVFGLPAPKLNIIYPSGPVTNDLSDNNKLGWAEETSLDVQMVHTLAPNATIDLVIAPSNYGRDLANAEKYAIDNQLGNVMSLSFGAEEDAATGHPFKAHVSQVHHYYEQATQAGMSVFASAGDGGSNGYNPFPTAEYPSSDPLVTAIGGTALFADAKTGAYHSESVWNDPFGATGGAPSIIFNADPWQNADKHAPRTTSDVAFNAAVSTGVLIYIGFLPPRANGFYYFGGTSEGAPAWAGIAALANQAGGHGLGSLNQKLYGLAGTPAFHDVTTGNNGAFSAAAGYDLPTGIGSPNVGNLIPALLAQ